MITAEDQKNIQQMIQNSIKQDSSDSQFLVGPIAAHAHTGVDSLQVDYSNISRLNIPNVSRITSTTSTGTPTPNVNTTDLFDISAQTATAAFQNPIGNPLNGQILRLRITSSSTGTPIPLTFSSSTGGYIGSSPILPSATTTGTTLMLGFMYDTTGSLNKWRLFQSANA